MGECPPRPTCRFRRGGNQTFCLKGTRWAGSWLSGPQPEDETTPSQRCGSMPHRHVPNNAAISLLKSKVTLNIAPAVGNPVSVSGDHVDASFEASKVKVGESITLTIATRGCDGELLVIKNSAVVIRREDAKTVRVWSITLAVHVGDTGANDRANGYRGVTDAGKATVW